VLESRNLFLSRKELLQLVWGLDISVGPKTVDVHIAVLRKKLEKQPRYPRHLLTVRGIGYRFVP
jgi:two-component system response regulator RegX3